MLSVYLDFHNKVIQLHIMQGSSQKGSKIFACFSTHKRQYCVELYASHDLDLFYKKYNI